MHKFSVLFLAVEKSSDIDMLFLYMNRDCRADIRKSWQAVLPKNGRRLQTQITLQEIFKLSVLNGKVLSTLTTTVLFWTTISRACEVFTLLDK